MATAPDPDDEITAVHCLNRACGARISPSEPGTPGGAAPPTECPKCRTSLTAPQRRTTRQEMAKGWVRDGKEIVEKLERRQDATASLLAARGRVHVEGFERWEKDPPDVGSSSKAIQAFSVWFVQAKKLLTEPPPPTTSYSIITPRGTK